MGKTRLALEICKTLRDEGWMAGKVDTSRPAAGALAGARRVRRTAAAGGPAASSLLTGGAEKLWIEPVMPDLLGEHLIEYELNRGAEELLDHVLGVPEARPSRANEVSEATG